MRCRVQINLISLHQTGGELSAPVEMHLLTWGNQFLGAVAASGSMYGHACAKTAISVAAIPHVSVLNPVR